MGKIYYGTAGWSYPDWKGIVYPEGKGKGDDLAFIAGYFDVVEINSTFYRPPDAANAMEWARRTEGAPGFVFTAKLHRAFTHERTETPSKAAIDEFRSGLEPLLESGKLGALLMQFPWSFRNNEEDRRRLASISRAFSGFPLVAELRHASWDIPPAYDFLRRLGVGFCNVDQPSSRDSLAPSSAATSPVGYVRFHGRNRENWFRKDAGRDARYDYLYSDAELEEWIPRIRAVAERTEKTFVIGNNHFKGQAPANILQIKSKMEGAPVEVPDFLLKAFPFLAGIR